MKTYKQRFIEACDQIASEYVSAEGHEPNKKTCLMCKLYDGKCLSCGINYFKENAGCIKHRTLKHLLKDDSQSSYQSPLRAKFYRTLVERVESLSPEEFTPSAISKPKSELLKLVRKVDKTVFKQNLFRKN